jgi:hypothetical protein
MSGQYFSGESPRNGSTYAARRTRNNGGFTCKTRHSGWAFRCCVHLSKSVPDFQPCDPQR